MHKYLHGKLLISKINFLVKVIMSIITTYTLSWYGMPIIRILIWMSTISIFINTFSASAKGVFTSSFRQS